MTRRECLAAGAALPARGTAPPNLVVLVADDLSNTLGCYGEPHVRTPQLDRLAGEGMRFDRAYVTSPQCSPSRSSAFTGRSPHATGTSRLHVPMPEGTPTVVESLRARGYFCGVYGKHHQGPAFPARFDDSGEQVQDFARFFERLPKRRPFFLWVGFGDPHRPYKPGAVDPPHDPARVRVPGFLPDTPRIRQDLALYYDYTSRLDTDCGRVLDILRRKELDGNTLVVFFGDNGMPFPRAKGSLYEPGINVPLIVRWPGRVKAGAVSRALVSVADLPPTFLDAAGAAPLKPCEGVSFRAILQGLPHSGRQFIFAERNFHDNWDLARGVVSERHSLICNYRPEVSYRGTLDHAGGPSWQEMTALRKQGALREPCLSLFAKPRPPFELYDIQDDPLQIRNLAGLPAGSEIFERHLKEMNGWMERTGDFLSPIDANWLRTSKRFQDPASRFNVIVNGNL